MMKFSSIADLNGCKGWILCHNIQIGEKTLLKDMQITSEMVKYVNLFKHSYDEFVIISSDIYTNTALKEFIKLTIKNFLDKEIAYINDRYYKIITDDYITGIHNLMDIILESFKLNYLLSLITTPVILRKSLDLSVMSFYFGFKNNVSLRELEDLIYSSMLCNLNQCNISYINDMTDEDFLIRFKKAQLETSYNIIHSDKNLTNNVKRIVKYMYMPNSGNGLYLKEESNQYIFQDVTLEIIQLSNDLLSYNFKDNYSYLYNGGRYSLVQPALSSFLKNIKYQKHKNKFQKIYDKIFTRKDSN